MALDFLKKKAKGDADSESQTSKKQGGGKVSMNRKNKGNALTISVPEAATELLQSNDRYIVNGQTVGAAVSISEAIGDLSNKKDSDIGQIVNYINHGTISAVVLEPLLADDTIIIIPDAGTIDNMRAYDSFKEAEYELCYVDLENGKIAPCFENETKIPFSDLENITNGRASLAEKLGLKTKPTAGKKPTLDDDDFDFDDDDDLEFGDPMYSDPLAGNFDDDEFGTDVPDSSFDGADYSMIDEVAAPAADEFDDTADAYIPEPEPEPEPEDPFEETIGETITQTAMRTFMVDDIAIEVSDEPFNMQFNATDLVLFSEKRPTDEGDGIANHLNECLNNMSKTANAEIRQARTAHLNELRTEYMNGLGEFVRTCINSELSTYGDTKSAQDRQRIEQSHRVNLDNLENEVNERKANIDREFNEAIQNVRNAAAEQAEHEYRETHQKQYIAQIDAIRNVVEQEIENTYINDIAKQNEHRHARALEMLDDAMILVLENLTIKYADMMTEERAIYQKHMESMLEFMSHQRYNEMNRIRVLHDEHARIDIAEKMSAKHSAEVADITAKFNAQKRALEADLDSMRKNLDVAVNRATAEAERTIANLRIENQKLIENADRAMAKLETADERAEAKYTSEIDSLHKEIERWEDESIKLHNGQKTSVLIMLGLACAAVIAAGAIGFISGQSHQAKEYTNSMRIETSYDAEPATKPTTNVERAKPQAVAPKSDVKSVAPTGDVNQTNKSEATVDNNDVVDEKENVDDIETTSGSVSVGEQPKQ